METEEISFLKQLIKTLEEAGANLEKFYEKKDFDNFNKSKKMMLKIQQEISNIIK
ncbi:hypothetical protein M0R19_02675 [Candidatus Pacearchaeota archaeon]|jgi:hypothetical protein|nr:hypothetical protein [Candidatus Pacearchaeota archaeon]